MEERYELMSEPDGKGKVLAKRLRDGKVARIRPSWVVKQADGTYAPERRTAVLRLFFEVWV